MKNKLTIAAFVLFELIHPAKAQQSGNQVVGHYYNNGGPNRESSPAKLYLSDTSFIVEASVLSNVIAEAYVATFGLSESSTTLKEANTKIDGRIQKFTAALVSQSGIPQSDIFVDMTTQTQIADYKVDAGYAEQYIAGFEQKKNVIVKYKNVKDLDKMVVIASGFGIYDLVKVDYITADVQKIYAQLFQAALEVINLKKELYVKATNMKVLPASQIYCESFYTLYPPQLYRSYTPNITTEYTDNNSYSKKKELRHNTTYYYEKVSYSGFDKVINPIVTEPAVEFVLRTQIKFEIEKNKK
jgi:uncharacterized protein YggE